MSEKTTEQLINNATQVERLSDRELIIRRTFQARPHIVFGAMTRPELFKRWFAPQAMGATFVDCMFDVRVGGTYRYVFGRPGEPSAAFSGTYREVIDGKRLVYTQIFEPRVADGEGVITATFEVQGTATRFTQRELYPSKAVLDFALSSGMERGMRETLEQLETLVQSLN